MVKIKSFLVLKIKKKILKTKRGLTASGFVINIAALSQKPQTSMPLEQKIATTLERESGPSSPKSETLIKVIVSVLMISAQALCKVSIEVCQDFIGCYFRDLLEDEKSAVECFSGNCVAKHLYETMVGQLGSYKRPFHIIADVLINTYSSMLKEARPADAEELLKTAEAFTLTFPLSARKFVEDGGAGLATTCCEKSTDEDMGPVIKTKWLFNVAMNMCGDNEEKAICLAVKAVNATLHVYSFESVVAFVAAKEDGAAEAARGPAIKKQKI